MIAFNTIILGIVALLLNKFPSKLKLSGGGTLLSRDTTSTWRGIAILGIILHHIALHTTYNTNTIYPIKFFVNECGFIFTGLFFLFSGFGCYYSIEKLNQPQERSQSIQTAKWFGKHFIRIFLDCTIVLMLDVALLSVLGLETISIKECFKDVFTLSIPLWTNWYPKIQVLCYLILSLSFVLARKRKEFVVLLLIITFMIIARFSGLQTYWYNSVLCFPIGIYIAKYSNKLNFSKKWLWIICLVSGAIFAVLYFMQAYLYIKIYIVSDLLRVFSAVMFCIFVISVSNVYRFDSKILKYIGNASFECYLLHLVAISVLSYYKIESNIAIVLIILLTVFLAIPINLILGKLLKKIK